MNKKYGMEWPDVKNQTWKENALETVEDFLQSVYNKTINWVSYKIPRITWVKIHNYDVYSADHTFAYIILPSLIKLKSKKAGAPFVEDSDVPEELRTPEGFDRSSGDVDDNHFKRWDYVLDEMIFAFNSKLDDSWEDQFHSGVLDFSFVKCEDKKGYSELVHGPNNTHVFDKEGYFTYQKRITNGFRLFGVYYENLWW